ncbi:hypothetical protein V3N99_16820 [Dermatophilaceae bacterium Soc4.6]
MLATLALAVVSAVGPLAWHPGLVVVVATVIALGSAAAVAALRPVVPAGTVGLAPGVPAVVGLSGLLFASFGTAGTFIPLMPTTLRDTGPAPAGVSLSVTSAFWSLGSWVQSLERIQERTSVVGCLRVGFVLLALGTLGPILLAVSRVSIVAGMALWALAATGMGVCSPTLATTTLALTPPEALGRSTRLAPWPWRWPRASCWPRLARCSPRGPTVSPPASSPRSRRAAAGPRRSRRLRTRPTPWSRHLSGPLEPGDGAGYSPPSCGARRPW